MSLTQNQYHGLEKDRPSVLDEGSTYLSTDTGVLWLYKEGGVPVTMDAATVTSSMRNVSDGLPNTDANANAFRTGKTGFGEANPEELIDIVGSEASGTGGFKYDYTWADGAISRFQLGGTNILSEVGLPSGTIQVNVFDYFGTGNQAGYRAYIYNGDIDSISGATGKLSIGMGVDTIASTQTCTFTTFTEDNGDGTEFTNRIINTHSVNGYTYLSFKGEGKNEFANERSMTVEFQNSGIKFGVSDYYTVIKDTIRLADVGDWVEGHAVGHPAGTYTDVGAITRGLGTDSNGFLMSVNGSYAGTAPSNASDSGQVGEIRVDGSFIYRCTATDTWERAPLTFATW